MFLLFLQADVTVDLNEASQLSRTHFVVILLRRAVGTLNTVHRHAPGPQHALYLSKDRVFLFEANVAEHVETDYIIKGSIPKGQPRELGCEGQVVAITAGGLRALG